MAGRGEAAGVGAHADHGSVERYASGAVSIDQLARERGLNDRTVNDILKNLIYNGWVMRNGERSPASWRNAPPVEDVLWARVQALLAARTRGGGPRRTEVPDPLRGLVRCVCGSTIRASGFTYGKRRRVQSVQPCPDGVRQPDSVQRVGPRLLPVHLDRVTPARAASCQTAVCGGPPSPEIPKVALIVLTILNIGLAEET